MTTQVTSYDLVDYYTGEILRTATDAEVSESLGAATHDGGVGAISVDGRTCYVAE